MSDDYERGRAAALEEAAAFVERISGTGGPSMIAKGIRALASPEYTCIPTADLEALLDLHDGEPLGLARDAYDRLRGAARRGRDAE